MTIACNEEGKFQIQHWPPLPVDDSVAILEILEVRMISRWMNDICWFLETDIYNGRNIKSNDIRTLSTSI